MHIKNEYLVQHFNLYFKNKFGFLGYLEIVLFHTGITKRVKMWTRQINSTRVSNKSRFLGATLWIRTAEMEAYKPRIKCQVYTLKLCTCSLITIHSSQISTINNTNSNQILKQSKPKNNNNNNKKVEDSFSRPLTCDRYDI